jgi:hypothetical protein
MVQTFKCVRILFFKKKIPKFSDFTYTNGCGFCVVATGHGTAVSFHLQCISITDRGGMPLAHKSVYCKELAYNNKLGEF